MPKCQLCKKKPAEWAMQYVAEDYPSFYTLGSHIRGFRVTKVCDTCRRFNYRQRQPTDADLTEREFMICVMRALALYCENADDYTHYMDDLTQKFTDLQWERLCQFIDLIDIWIGDTEKASLYQREKWAAFREGRKSEYPSVFDLGSAEARPKLRELEKKHGITAPADLFEERKR